MPPKKKSESMNPESDNPRGHNHNGLNVEKSVEKNGIDIAQTMIWRKAKKDDPKAHG
eukprot:gene7523-8957_t